MATSQRKRKSKQAVYIPGHLAYSTLTCASPTTTAERSDLAWPTLLGAVPKLTALRHFTIYAAKLPIMAALLWACVLEHRQKYIRANEQTSKRAKHCSPAGKLLPFLIYKIRHAAEGCSQSAKGRWPMADARWPLADSPRLPTAYDLFYATRESRVHIY